MNGLKYIKDSYKKYATKTLKDRAIPSLDGLKPVHRRLLYAMYQDKMFKNKNRPKCTKAISGTLMLHPHGDSAVYGALVRLAQDFSNSVPLIDGDGNFGNLYDPDGFAAYRYTYCRLSPHGQALAEDLKRLNIRQSKADEDMLEPEILSLKFPNLFVNGTLGIASGFSCTYLPHKISNVVRALKSKIANGTEDDIIKELGHPNLPTYGQNVIMNEANLKDFYSKDGFGLVVRGDYEIKGDSIIIKGLPYQVSIDNFMIKVAQLIKDGQLEEIKDVIDKTKGSQINIMVKCTKGTANLVLDKLMTKTAFRKTFKSNYLVIKDDSVISGSIYEIMDWYLNEYHNQLITQYEKDLAKYSKDLHLNDGIVKILLDVDKAIKLIRASKDKNEAREKLISAFDIDGEQADKVLGITLSRLTKMSSEEIEKKSQVLRDKIVEMKILIADKGKREEVMVAEWESFVDERNEITYTTAVNEVFKTKSSSKGGKNITLRQSGLYIVGDAKSELVDTIESKGKTGVPFKRQVDIVYEESKNTTTPLLGFYADGDFIRFSSFDDIDLTNIVSIVPADKEVLAVLFENDKAKRVFTKEFYKMDSKRMTMNKKMKGMGAPVKQVVAGDIDDFIAIGFEEGVLITNDLSTQGKTAKGVKIEKGANCISFFKNAIVSMNVDGEVKRTKDLPVLKSRGSKPNKWGGNIVSLLPDVEKMYIVSDKGNILTVPKSKIKTMGSSAKGNKLFSSTVQKVVKAFGS